MVRRNRKRLAKRARRRDGCAGKKRYGYDDAKTAAAEMVARTRLVKAAVYFCDRCCWFHVSRSIGPDCVAVVEKVPA